MEISISFIITQIVKEKTELEKINPLCQITLWEYKSRSHFKLSLV